MSKLFIVGISDNYLSREQEQLISSSSLIVGTERFKEIGSRFQVKYHDISPLSDSLDTIKSSLLDGNVCVLASGDPLFYGIGKLLLRKFSKDIIEIVPAVSSLQRACALFKLPWDDAKIVSLHGRQIKHTPGVLLAHPKTIVFTDSSTSPNILATDIINYLNLIGNTDLLNHMVMHVAEDLGMKSQNVISTTVTQISDMQFSSLNVVGLEIALPNDQRPYSFGLREEDIQHSRGLITKCEVRAATLHQLQLPPKGVFWDIGAGSGSVSIEAALLNPGLTVYAVEHKLEEIENIKNNIVKFGCYNIVPIHGGAPDSLLQLPDPDRVFIGGSGGSLPSIIAHISQRNGCENVRLVINGVIEKTIQEAPKELSKHGFTVEKSTVTVTRSDQDDITVQFNPITIMTGTK